MRRFIICLVLVVAAISEVSAQNYWEINRFKDEFGDPIEEPSAYFAQNTAVRNSYSYLCMRFGINKHSVVVLTFSVVSTTGFAPERREVSAPATLSFKTNDGKIHRFTSNDDDGGDIWFFGDDALKIGKLFNERNYSIALTVKSYLDGSKTYRYSIGETTQGLGQTLHEMEEIIRRKY